jgi:hypothetical protein
MARAKRTSVAARSSFAWIVQLELGSILGIMMKTLQLTRFAKARVWFGERVTDGFKPDGVITSSVENSFAGGPTRNVMVGLEALLPTGARAEYGLVVLEFLPDHLGRLQIEVPYSGMTGIAWPDALAGKLDDVRLGLPKEYTSAVLGSLCSAGEGRVPSGVIRIVDAAHGLVGSSPNFFGKITRSALELALLDGTEVSDDYLASLLRGILIE